MKEIKEAMQSVINEIGYWVFLFVLLFVPWILTLIRFIKHYPSHSILFDSNDVKNFHKFPNACYYAAFLSLYFFIFPTEICFKMLNL